jgi:hypothetical protein
MEFGLLPFLMTELVGGELGVVEFLTGRDQMENDSGQLVGRCRDAFGAPSLARMRR